ncbi:G patch domain-containing protein 8 [Nymphaea thermarum]|nr:G patch domain-containing protein 8 [Nymphaea thermarum]
MDRRWSSRTTWGNPDRRKREEDEDEVHEALLLDDLVEEFRLPISHRPTENLDIDNIEQASLDTQLTSSNIGFRLLQKMGWKGKGLGKDEQGIVEPIRAGIRDPKLGVGKQEQDDFFTAEENVQRKKLEVEIEETEEHVKKRERFKEMKELHGSSSRDDRLKREQQRQEREMAKYAQLYHADT